MQRQPSLHVLATRIQKAAEARKLDAVVEANFPLHMDRREEAIELVPRWEPRLREVGMPYGLIEMTAYGQVDGEKVLDQALALCSSSQDTTRS